MSHYVEYDIYGKYGYTNDVHPESVSNCLDCDKMYDEEHSSSYSSELMPRCNGCLEAYHRRSDLLDSLSSVFEELMDKVSLIRNHGEESKLEAFKDICDESWFQDELSGLYATMTTYFESKKKESTARKKEIKKSAPVKNIEKIKEIAKRLSNDPAHRQNAYETEKSLVEKHGDFFQYNDKNQRMNLDYFKLSEALSKSGRN